MKKTVNKTPIIAKDNTTRDEELVLDFAVMLQVNRDLATDHGKDDPYAFTGYSIAVSQILRGVYTARKSSQDYLDSAEQRVQSRATLLGGDPDVMEADDLYINMLEARYKATKQYECLINVSHEIVTKYKAVTNEDAQSYEDFLTQRTEWQAKNGVKKKGTAEEKADRVARLKKLAKFDD